MELVVYVKLKKEWAAVLRIAGYSLDQRLAVLRSAGARVVIVE